MIDYSEIEKAFVLWKKGIAQADKVPAGWFTSREMAKAKGIHQNTALKILKALKDSNLVEVKKFRVDVGGHLMLITHYKTNGASGKKSS